MFGNCRNCSGTPDDRASSSSSTSLRQFSSIEVASTLLPLSPIATYPLAVLPSGSERESPEEEQGKEGDLSGA